MFLRRLVLTALAASGLVSTSVVAEDINSAPVISSVPASIADVGHGYSYALTVTDADGDEVTVDPGDLPETASWDEESRTLDWRVTADEIGMAHSEFSVSYGVNEPVVQ